MLKNTHPIFTIKKWENVYWSKTETINISILIDSWQIHILLVGLYLNDAYYYKAFDIKLHYKYIHIIWGSSTGRKR